MSSVEFNSGRGVHVKSEVPDKVDMSLDDIIRLNKRQLKTQRTGPGNRKQPTKSFFPNSKSAGSRAGAPPQRGGGAPRFGVRGRKVPPPVARRKGQGVITGLAARRGQGFIAGRGTRRAGPLHKGVSPLNRPMGNQKPRPFVQRAEAPYRRLSDGPRRPYRQMDTQRGPNLTTRRPFQLRRRTLPQIHQAQRDARQATFLLRRGLKVHTQVQTTAPPPPAVRTRQWRTSTTSSGILTVSIDNPTARSHPEPPSAWSLHPAGPPAPPPVKDEEERRPPPKGVPLQFDINSVGKQQTAMTLNERFRILKDKRVATAHTSKAGRFVTVG